MYKWVFFVLLIISTTTWALIDIGNKKRGKCMRRRKHIGVLEIMFAPILFFGALDKASNKLKRFYVRPKRSGVMCSGPRRGKRRW